MPLYEYYCRSCSGTFERLRPMSRSSEPAPCPQGHRGGQRVVSVFSARVRGEGGSVAVSNGGGGCGGCAGGACACSGH